MVRKSYITLKVVAGLLFVFAAISASLYIINTSLKVHSNLINKIDDPNTFINSWDKVLKGLDKAGNEIYSYSLNNDSSALKRFDQQQTLLNLSLDTLKRITATNKGRKPLVDSLAKLTDKRLELFAVRSYTVIENMEMKAFDKASQKMVTTEKQSVAKQKKVVAEDPVKVNATPEKTSFLKRFFTRKNKGKDKDKDNPQPLQQPEIKDEGPSLATIINSLRNAELSAKEENQKKVLDLISEEQKVDGKIYNLTRQMERLEIKSTGDQIKETSDDLEMSTDRIMIMLGLGGFVFLLFFVYFIQRDVSRGYMLQKQLDEARIQAENLAKARQDFAANMSHEIRTPLNALIGFSEQLVKSPLNTQQQKMANALQRSSQHLLSVINPVLDYSKLLAGKEVIEQIPFKISEVLLDVGLLFEKQAAAKNIKLITGSDYDIPDYVTGDVVKLRQVLYNLTSNAIKFTHTGHVKVHCSAIKTHDNTVTYLFTVEDTGIGIPENKLDAVFDEFTQADNSVTRNYGGTGLGLNIAKRLIELQGGTITVTSTVGKGSVFSLTITYPIATQPTEQKVDTNYDTGKLLDGKTIIVCDDEDMNRMLLEHILVTYGAKIIEVPSAQKMLDLLSTTGPDVILLDLHMPGISGIEALKAIRSNPNILLSKIPVIAVTGTVVEGEKERCLAEGMNGFLTKPFVEQQLIDCIKSVLAKT